ncbi:MAG: hypothetical protein BJ554DRAFT_6491, partial [Olpidium bornovanus]
PPRPPTWEQRRESPFPKKKEKNKHPASSSLALASDILHRRRQRDGLRKSGGGHRPASAPDARAARLDVPGREFLQEFQWLLTIIIN